LLDGPMRTNELRKSIPEITERMLFRHLRDMTEARILERHQEQGLPLRVRYSLTPYGRTLVPVLEVLCSWGRTVCFYEPSRSLSDCLFGLVKLDCRFLHWPVFASELL
jgi:DNA-binding HxlR family transcriptional regulator